MMKNNFSCSLILLFVGSVSLSVQAHDTGYWTDSSGKVVRTGYGECVRSIGWTPDKATAECGGEKKVMDADGDGIVDKDDQCPGTPTGVSVDANGCTLDSDRDGVADSNDRCPNTAAGVSVDAAGCELDADNDGVVDSKDRCPGTQAGVTVDDRGCEVNMDSDGDGITNANDDCPNTAAGIAVNTRGCELKADIRLDNVQFKTATAELSAESQSILDNIARVLNDNQHLKFEVAGHTDNRGDYNYNVKLSESRAQSVRDYLVNKGVAGNRLTARGYGPDKPIANNDTSDGRRQNRRVELVLQ